MKTTDITKTHTQITEHALAARSIKKEFSIEDEDLEKCPECGHTPETGACFFCKMD